MNVSALLGAASPYAFKPVAVYGGGYVDGIVFHPTQPNLIYARTDMGGAYRYDDTNKRWIPLTDFLNRDQADFMGNLSLALDARDPSKVYLLTGKYTQSWAGNGALLASSDQGATWAIHTLPFKVGGNEDGRGAGERLAVDPNLGSILWAGSNASGLYKSVNGGTSFSAVGSFPGANPTFIVIDPASGSGGSASQTLWVGVAATANNLYRSTNGGSTWSVVGGGPAQYPLQAVLSGTRLYITYADALGPNGVTGGSIQRLDTGTLGWTAVTPPAGQGGWCGVGVLPGASDKVVAATLDRWWPADEVYYSANSGGSWSAKLSTAVVSYSEAPWTSTGTPHWMTDIQIDPFNPDRAFFTTGYGVFGTTNLTAATPLWRFNSAGIEQTVPLQLISPPSGSANLLSAMGDVDGFRHTNLDVPPLQRHQPELGTTLAIAFAENAPSKMVKAYNAGAPSNYGGYSADGGSSWTAFAAYPAGAYGGGTRSIAISADGASIVWCPAGGACSLSTNNGGAWTACTGGIPGGLEPVADRVNASKLYAAEPLDTGGSRVWVSGNGGASFALGATGLPVLPSYLYSDCSLKATLGLEGDLWLTLGSNGLYHSTNSGASFSKLANVSAAYEVSTGLKAPSGSYPALYLFGTVSGTRGFYRSDDAGASWTRINDDQHQYGWLHDFSGDPRVYGRLYLCAEGRGILYGDLPVAGSPTPTVTPSATASGSPTRSATPTATGSATASPSPSASATASPSASPTSSASASRTASPSPSVSASASPTASASASPSSTRTATPSATASGTRTVSTTASPSATATPTFTDVPPGSSATATPTASPSATPSASATATPSVSATATPSATPTGSSTPSSSASVSPSAVATATSSATVTPSASPSLTPSESPASSATATPSASPTASVSVSASASPSPPAAASATPTPTATATATLAASATPGTGEGSLRILALAAYPQPRPRELRLRLDGPADRVEVERYSSALVLVDRLESGPLGAGWQSIALPAPPSPGLYFLRVTARRGGLSSPPLAPLRCVNLP